MNGTITCRVVANGCLYISISRLHNVHEKFKRQKILHSKNTIMNAFAFAFNEMINQCWCNGKKVNIFFLLSLCNRNQSEATINQHIIYIPLVHVIHWIHFIITYKNKICINHNCYDYTFSHLLWLVFLLIFISTQHNNWSVNVKVEKKLYIMNWKIKCVYVTTINPWPLVHVQGKSFVY